MGGRSGLDWLDPGISTVVRASQGDTEGALRTSDPMNIFGLQKGPGVDDSGLKTIQDAALSMYREGSSDYRGQGENRTNFANQLANNALGKGPSLAEAQMRSALDRNLSQQIAAYKSNRSVNPALAMRQNGQQAAQSTQQIAQAAGTARLAEQSQNQQAYQSYLNSLQAGRTSALGAGSGAAGQIAQMSQAENAAQQQRQGQMLGMAGSALMMFSDKNVKTGIKKYSKGGMVDKVKARKYADGGLVSQRSPGDGQNMQDAGPTLGHLFSKMGQTADMQMMSQGGSVPGQAQVAGDSEQNDVVPALLSPGEVVVPRTIVNKGQKAVTKFVTDAIRKDQGSKEPVKMAKGGVVADSKDEFKPKNFLDALQATSFEYKNDTKSKPGAGDNRYLGVMAQDLEKAGPVGRSMVTDGPEGKSVDYGKGFSAILASQAELNSRLSEIEKKWNKGGK